MQHRVAVVTDSTACLPVVAGVTVVPVQVIAGNAPHTATGTPGTGVATAGGQAVAPDGGSPGGEAVAPGGGSLGGEVVAPGGESGGKVVAPEGESLGGGGAAPLAGEDSFTGDLATATTSRPSPASFAACYASLAAAGATAIVSIHLSREMSGTVDSAMAAAREAPVPVEVIDSRSIAMGLGYPVLAAARAAAEGASPEAVASAARRRIGTTRTFFYVDNLDFVRRSGRIGTAASLVGSALMIKPLLHIADGRILLLEKVRTASRAIARLEDLAVEAAGERAVAVAVQHLGAQARAEALAERLPKRLPGPADVRVMEVGAVLGVHVGPGMLGLTVTTPDR